MNILDTVRLGRSSANHLRSLVKTHTLTEADAERLLGRIDTAFNEVMGAAEQSRSRHFTVIEGGRS